MAGVARKSDPSLFRASVDLPTQKNDHQSSSPLWPNAKLFEKDIGELALLFGTQ